MKILFCKCFERKVVKLQMQRRGIMTDAAL